MMTALTGNRVVLSSLTQFIIPMVIVAVLGVPKYSFAQNGYQDSESYRADLLTVLQLQRKITQDLQGQSAANDSPLALVERVIYEADALSLQELQALQKIGFSLAPAIESLEALDNAITLANSQSKNDENHSKDQFKTGTSAVVIDCDGYIERRDDNDDLQLTDPPGPCGQANYQPPADADNPSWPPLDFVPPSLELTDNEYPNFFTCKKYAKRLLVIASRVAVLRLDIATTVQKRICDQSITVAGFGGTLSLGCIPLETIFLVAKGIKETISSCHSFRIASEGTSTYVRAGELFVQSRQNTDIVTKRANSGFTNSQDGLDEIKNQVEENSRKIEQTISTLNEIMRTMNIEDARLLDEDPELD